MKHYASLSRVGSLFLVFVIISTFFKPLVTHAVFTVDKGDCGISDVVIINPESQYPTIAKLDQGVYTKIGGGSVNGMKYVYVNGVVDKDPKIFSFTGGNVGPFTTGYMNISSDGKGVVGSSEEGGDGLEVKTTICEFKVESNSLTTFISSHTGPNGSWTGNGINAADTNVESCGISGDVPIWFPGAPGAYVDAKAFNTVYSSFFNGPTPTKNFGYSGSKNSTDSVNGEFYLSTVEGDYNYRIVIFADSTRTAQLQSVNSQGVINKACSFTVKNDNLLDFLRYHRGDINPDTKVDSCGNPTNNKNGIIFWAMCSLVNSLIDSLISIIEVGAGVANTPTTTSMTTVLPPTAELSFISGSSLVATGRIPSGFQIINKK